MELLTGPILHVFSVAKTRVLIILHRTIFQYNTDNTLTSRQYVCAI